MKNLNLTKKSTKLTKIIIAVAMLLTVQSTNLFAQQPPKASNGCVSGNCVNGKGKKVYDNGDTYEGNFVNGEREGQGTFKFINGSYYTGEWKNDKINGYGNYYDKLTDIVQKGTWKDSLLVECVSGNCVNGRGKYVYPDGSIYEGNFVNSKFNGQGTLTFKSGDVYTGQFSNNARNGKGTYKFASGGIYDGNWIDGKKNGKGTSKDTNGNIYEGNWVDNKYHGKGKLTFTNGTIYDGNWVEDKKNGKGTYKYASGDIYEGNYVNDNKEGQGTETSKNGNYYTGEWKNGKRNGYGKEYIKATNTVREGIWKDDVFVSPASQKGGFSQADLDEFNKQNPNVGKEKVQFEEVILSSPTANKCISGNCVNGFGKYHSSDGDTYEGDFVNGKREGQGTLTFKDGDVYTGQFSNNVRNGKGTIKYANGDTYEGDFASNKREGKGTYTYKDGSYDTGEWKNDKQNGYEKEYDEDGELVRESTWKDGVFVGNSAAKTPKTEAAKTLKTEKDWQQICAPFVSKMENAVDAKKDDELAKKVYGDFEKETETAGKSPIVRNIRQQLLKTMHRSNNYPLIKFVMEKLETLDYNEEETKDILSPPRLYYV